MNIKRQAKRALRSGLSVAGALILTGSVMVASPPSALGQAAAVGGKSVTINLQNAPVQTVLRSLFKSAGMNFTIDPAVTGTVTVDVNGVSFQQALDAILSGTNPPLDAQLTNGIYHVAVQQAQPVAPAANQSSQNNNTPSTATDPHHAYRIPISHYDAAYMSYLVAAFSRKGGAPIVVPSDPNSQSSGGGMGGGMMGGMGGMGGGMMGGMGGMMGGMGGGMMGGMGGMGGGMMGGMGGMMGGMGGGMMGGMGGMGGGMMGGMGGMGGGMMGGMGGMGGGMMGGGGFGRGF